MTSISEDRPRRRPLVAVFFCFGFGLFCLATGLNRPTVASMRTIDLVHLLATGALLGMGLAALIQFFVGRRTS
jgi:hypothetical protein